MQVPARPPSIRIAFRTFGRTLRHGYDNLGVLGLASLLWTLFALPLLPFFNIALGYPSAGTLLLLLAALAIVPISPATIGLHRVVQPMTEERASAVNRFWSHFRGDWLWSTKLVMSLAVGLVVWDANRRFYNQSGNTPLLLLSGFFFVLTLVWLGIMFYALPLALRQTDQRVRITLRNAVVLGLANLPGMIVSLLLLLLSCVLLLIPPLFVLIPGWIALWSEENVRLLLVAGGHIRADEIADRARGG